ncbi:MAG: peptidoglycan binding domain protein [Phenylobacterium sp.]|nr:peptidoglycan binding domain protein [Phenylobacterium sp.]
MSTFPARRPIRRRTLLAALPALALAARAYGQAVPPVLPGEAAPAVPPPPLPPPVPLPVLSRSQIEIAVSTLNAADTHGLPRRRVSAEDPPDELASALAQYAKAVHVGRLEPADFPKDWGVRPPPYDPRPDFAAAATTDRLQEWLDSLPPAYAGYNALRRGLAAYRAIAGRGGWKPVPAGGDFGLGAKGARVAALRARLAAEDPAVEAGGPASFDEGLQQGLARAQRRFGLKPDGVVTAETLSALNQPVGQRVLQIIANLERWRWLPPTMPATRLQVNSGAAIVTLFQDDRPVLSMKAVSGRPGDETPMLLSTVHSVVLNPPWNVPSSIATKELWPKEKKRPGYLARNGFVVIKTDDGGVRLQQKAGSKSALGRYKFDFDNPYGVYLHDTPTQTTFAHYGRQASHGCVRLEKPRALAEALLAGDPTWTPDAIAAAIDKGDTVRARLTQRVPVFIFYWTAFASPDGTMNFRSDPYSWDSLLLQRIGVLGGTQA